MSLTKEERRLTTAFAAFTPEGPRIEELLSRVLATLEARSIIDAPLPSLAREWLELLQQRPVANTLLAAAAAGMLLVTTPLMALPFLLFA